MPIISPIVSVGIAPLPPHVFHARRFHSSVSAAIATIESPPDVAPVFGCRCGNVGFFSPRDAKRRHHFSAPSRRQLENGQIDVGSSGCAALKGRDSAPRKPGLDRFHETIRFKRLKQPSRHPEVRALGGAIAPLTCAPRRIGRKHRCCFHPSRLAEEARTSG
jgi:hypothetical protein